MAISTHWDTEHFLLPGTRFLSFPSFVSGQDLNTTLQTQPLLSIMGKLHYKGKKNFIEHLTKFPDTYG